MHDQITYQLPESVVEDTRGFCEEVGRIVSGETPPADFRKMRAAMGIYEQREDGTYMVRVRGAAGLFWPSQVKLVADLAEAYGNGVVHVTTRQDLQMHGVRIDDVPVILERLLEGGLSTRGGGGDCVRNVSACPLAGACGDEAFDVTPYALAVTGYLARDRGSFSLPRKFKVAFSGCGRDCGLCSVADLGFFAHEREGVHGFSVYAGGGLGACSALGICIEDFVAVDRVFEVAEAVKRLFDRHGDRSNRSRARLRFVVERLGQDEFCETYREELALVRREGIEFPKAPIWEDRQRESVIDLRPALGDIPARHLRTLAGVAKRYDGTIRATQDQNLQLRGIPEAETSRAHEAVRAVDESLLRAGRVRCVACVGASTCRMGACLSRELGATIEETLRELPLPFEAVIRISGCPNSCGQHPIAPLGLYGSPSRVDGSVVESYTIVAGGRLAEGGSAFAKPVGKVRAEAVAGVLEQFFAAAGKNWRAGESMGELMDRWGCGYLSELTAG